MSVGYTLNASLGTSTNRSKIVAMSIKQTLYAFSSGRRASRLISSSAIIIDGTTLNAGERIGRANGIVCLVESPVISRTVIVHKALYTTSSVEVTKWSTVV